MIDTTIIGRTSLFSLPTHEIEIDGTVYDAAVIANSGLPGPISAIANTPVLQCLECGGAYSAFDLYAASPVAGECEDCASEELRTLPRSA